MMCVNNIGNIENGENREKNKIQMKVGIRERVRKGLFENKSIKDFLWMGSTRIYSVRSMFAQIFLLCLETFAQFGFERWQVVGVASRVYAWIKKELASDSEQELALMAVRIDYRAIQFLCWGKYTRKAAGCPTNFCCMSGCGLVRFNNTKWCALHIMPKNRQPQGSDLDYCYSCKYRPWCSNNVRHWLNGDPFTHCGVCNEILNHPNGRPFPFWLAYKVTVFPNVDLPVQR